MRSVTRPLAMIGAFGALCVACVKVPYTERRQFNLIPDVVMRPVGKATYDMMLADLTVRKKGENNKVLQKVGRKISAAAKQPKYDWQFALINDDTVNAWCLPGGYIGFYDGILPALENEAGMAFVMGHEVGHATAHHGAERLSQQLAVVGGMVGLELWMKDHTKLKPAERQVLLGALGVGVSYGVMLPFSRMHEAEADVIGMMYMASAGYPPAESLKVWDRMDAESGGASMPGFLSTHPTTEKRQANQKDWLPTARKKYERNKLAYDTKTPLWGKAAKKTAGNDSGNTTSRRGVSETPQKTVNGAPNTSRRSTR